MAAQCFLLVLFVHMGKGWVNWAFRKFQPALVLVVAACIEMFGALCNTIKSFLNGMENKYKSFQDVYSS
jgi:hypothetical protein